MRVLSINVGLPHRIETSADPVVTSIFKSAVAGRVALRAYNLAGDRQSDLRVHGGPYKAVYLYPFEHYSYWAAQLPAADLSFGAFGENLTTEGITEETAHIGDQFRIGSAIVQVTQPRMPCYKLALRFGRSDMVRRFWESERPGIYFSIVEEGELEAGDAITLIDSHPDRVSVSDVGRLYRGETADSDLLDRALRAPLHGSWKAEIQNLRS